MKQGLLKDLLSNQFLRFLVAGGIAALANFFSRFIYSEYVSFEISIVFAYLTGFVTAFILMKYTVFKPKNSQASKELAYFFAVNLAAILQTWIISIYLANYLLVDQLSQFSAQSVAHLIGVLFPVFTSFIGHKYLTFNNKNN
jgi:putative flippase GtrA